MNVIAMKRRWSAESSDHLRLVEGSEVENDERSASTEKWIDWIMKDFGEARCLGTARKAEHSA